MKSCSISSQHLVGPGVGAVELVEHDDGRQVAGQGLGQHVAGLGQRALGRVDQQQHAVDQGQRPLDLTAEVGVARGVDQVDLDAPPHHRGGLGQDGDAPLPLLVVGVHHPIDHRLVGGEDPGGAEQAVDQGGLAVVDVRDEGDVAEGHQEALFRGVGVEPLNARSAMLHVVVFVVVEGDVVLLRQGGVLVVLLRLSDGPRSGGPNPKAAGPDCFSFRASSKRR